MVEIIKGTFGYFDGKRVKPITQNDGPQKFDKELEERLVKQGIARYLDPEKPAPEKGKPESDEQLPEYNKDMKLADLKEIAKAYGVDASKCSSKAEVCDLIDEARAEDDEEPDLSPAAPV